MRGKAVLAGKGGSWGILCAPGLALELGESRARRTRAGANGRRRQFLPSLPSLLRSENEMEGASRLGTGGWIVYLLRCRRVE
jgi:hypothetical protein